MSVAVGVDGTAAGWVAVVLVEARFERALLVPRFADVLAAVPHAAAVAVDIPVGLLEEGTREADAAARAFLGAQASSVFATGPRCVYEAADYAEALRRARRHMGKGLSKQSWFLRAKILDVDPWSVDPRVHECHPEVAFRLLAGRPLGSKKTWGGVAARREALAAAGVVLPDALGAADAAAPDDVLDAAVTAWSAVRIAAGAARSFPERTAQRDPRTGRAPRIQG